MINRGYLARVRARLHPSAPKEAIKKPGSLLTKKVVMKDPETREVVKEFESVLEAVEEGFNAPNIAGALKTGNKYKGHLWAEIEE